VTYFRGLTSLSHCPDFPTPWLVPDDCPSAEPSGWPNCDTPMTAKTKVGENATKGNSAK
jgi:hypothetical protein